MSLVALSFFAPDLDSDCFSALELAGGCGVEFSDAFSSDALPLLAAAASFSFSFVGTVIVDLAAGFAMGFAAGFEALDAVGGAYLAVLLYSDISFAI